MKFTKTLFLLSILVSSCGRFSNEEKKEDHQERIVLISKHYCELIYALGAQKDIVAVDVSSIYPPEVKNLPTVGYHRALSLEGILSAKPTLIMHAGLKSLGPEHIVKQLQDLKIPMKEFESKGDDIESAKQLFKEMGIYFHKEKEADSLCNKLDTDMKKALQATTNYTYQPKVLIIHFGRATNHYMVISKMGTAGKMVEWGGGVMAINDSTRMKQLSAEIVSQSNPDVILLTDFGYDRLGSPDKIKELPGVASTNAAKNNQIFRIDEHDLIYIGPRTGENILKMQHLIHQHEVH